MDYHICMLWNLSGVTTCWCNSVETVCDAAGLSSLEKDWILCDDSCEPAVCELTLFRASETTFNL